MGQGLLPFRFEAAPRPMDLTARAGLTLPPSGKFGANAAWYRLALLTYNVCTVLRHRALPARFADARPQRLRYEVFTIPAALTAHARQLTAQLGVPPLTAEELITARGNLRALRTTLQAAEGIARR